MPSEPCRRGYDTPAELAELRELARGRVVLELGSHRGDATIAMAETATRVYTVDHFWPNPAEGDREFGEEFLARTRTLRLAGLVVVLVGSFDAVCSYLAPRAFDLVFVDGFHDLEAQTEAIVLADRLLKPDAVLAVHDWGRFEVIPACERLLPPPARVVDSLAIWR